MTDMSPVLATIPSLIPETAPFSDEQRAWRAYLRAGTLLSNRLNRQLQAQSGLSLP